MLFAGSVCCWLVVVGWSLFWCLFTVAGQRYVMFVVVCRLLFVVWCLLFVAAGRWLLFVDVGVVCCWLLCFCACRSLCVVGGCIFFVGWRLQLCVVCW